MASATKSCQKTPTAPGADTAPPTAEAIALALAPLLAEQLQGALSTAVALGPDALFSVDEASAILRRSPATLEKWRADAIGPRAVKTGLRSIAYRLDDLRAFIRDAEATFPAHTRAHPSLDAEATSHARKRAHPSLDAEATSPAHKRVHPNLEKKAVRV